MKTVLRAGRFSRQLLIAILGMQLLLPHWAYAQTQPEKRFKTLPGNENNHNLRARACVAYYDSDPEFCVSCCAHSVPENPYGANGIAVTGEQIGVCTQICQGFLAARECFDEDDVSTCQGCCDEEGGSSEVTTVCRTRCTELAIQRVNPGFEFTEPQMPQDVPPPQSSPPSSGGKAYGGPLFAYAGEQTAMFQACKNIMTGNAEWMSLWGLVPCSIVAYGAGCPAIKALGLWAKGKNNRTTETIMTTIYARVCTINDRALKVWRRWRKYE